MPIDPTKLAEFTGSETFYRHGLNRNIVYTQGVQYVAEEGGAFWLVDEVASGQLNPIIQKHDFQVWKLKKTSPHTAILTVEDGDYNEIFAKPIGFTDFPLDSMEFWFMNNTIYLPSEH